MINTTEFWEKVVVMCIDRGDSIENALNAANAALKEHPDVPRLKPAAVRIFVAPEKLIAGWYRIASILAYDDSPAHHLGDVVHFTNAVGAPEPQSFEAVYDTAGGSACYFIDASNGGNLAVASGTWASALELLNEEPSL